MSSNEQNHFSGWDCVWTHAQVATMQPHATAYGMLNDAAIAVKDGQIAWLGACSDLDQRQLQHCEQVLDCQGALVTPGLIDCHTHLVYAGNRANEFEQRLNGASYAQIAESGGGISATVSATRQSTKKQLLELSQQRLAPFLTEGVTTVEIKSGYGLNLDTEIKQLQVARMLGERLPLQVVTTFLGAHALPPEYTNSSDDYIDALCQEYLPLIVEQHLADHVDAFCEHIAFSPQQIARVFQAAQQFDLPIKLHAEQLSDQKGALLAAKMGALSVDHLEYLAEGDVAALSHYGCTAVLLPGAFYFLRETQQPPVEALRQQGVPMAIASDHNPGSSPVYSLLLMLNMACTLFDLTPEEALAGVTRNAARALGLDRDIGTLEVGKKANLVRWDAEHPSELSYAIAYNPCRNVLFEGQLR